MKAIKITVGVLVGIVALGGIYLAATGGIQSDTGLAQVIRSVLRMPSRETFTPESVQVPPPAAPTLYTADATACNSSIITWRPVTDYSGAQVKNYSLYRNGVVSQTVDGRVAYTYETGLSGNTNYTYAVSATDNGGRTSSTSTSISITTSPCEDKTPPTVSIASPTGGEVKGTVVLTINASDNFGIKQVKVFANDRLLATLTAAPYVYKINTMAVANGAYKVVAEASDNSGLVAKSAPVIYTVVNPVVIVNPPPPSIPPVILPLPITVRPPVVIPPPLPVPVVTVPGSELAKNVLVVYNASSSDSIALKDYYLKNRPGMSGAYTLALQFAGEPERITQAEFDSKIAAPIRDFSSAGNINIEYIVMMYGLPTRTYDASKDIGGDPNYPPATQGSVAGQIYGYLSKKPVSMDMGSVEATKVYIDKLAYTYSKMQHPNFIISASDAGLGGNNYYLDDVNRTYAVWTPAAEAQSEVKRTSPGTLVTFPTTAHQYDISNVLGFLVWGGNTYNPDGSSDLGNNYMHGKFKFSGNSSWYLIQTIESWNGRRSSAHLANFTQWFDKTAFGGTNYDKTPAGAIVSVDEPTNHGTNNALYFSLWNAGPALHSNPARYTGSVFADAAWLSSQTPYSITRYPVMNAIGDPLITK